MERGAEPALRCGSHFKCQSSEQQDQFAEASYLFVV
jgi:hypothetical protein